MPEEPLHRQNIVALLWDCDKTLIPGYMQRPIFDHYGVDERTFWDEVNGMEPVYRQRGMHPAPDILYLNHLLTYVRHGRMKGLNNRLLHELGGQLTFYQGLPEFFPHLRELVQRDPLYARYEIKLEHYIISTGLAEMIRGSAIAPHADGIFGAEFIENPLPPGYNQQDELAMEITDTEIGQIGQLVDNTIKTRFIFEINKGTNRIQTIDVNSQIAQLDRRIPIPNMIYVADGPSDIPAYSVVKRYGGQTYAVYEPGNEKEFAQNDALRASGRVDHFGRADYRPKSDTHLWLTAHVRKICDRIVEECEQALQRRVGRPPRHLHDDPPSHREATGPQQEALWKE